MSIDVKISDPDSGKDVKMRRAGGSYACTFPVSVFEAAGFKEGSIGTAFVAEDGSIVITHKAPERKRKRYSLDALLSELPATFELSDEQKAWEQMRPVGNEL